MTLNEWAKEIHDNSIAHGWWEEERSFAEIVALCHAELSEALEEERNNHPMLWWLCEKNPNANPRNCDLCPYEHDGTCDVPGEKLKPEGKAVEMMDCIIRILDWMGKENIDVDKILQKKHEYNKTRPYRHGGKKL